MWKSSSPDQRKLLKCLALQYSAATEEACRMRCYFVLVEEAHLHALSKGTYLLRGLETRFSMSVVWHQLTAMCGAVIYPYAHHHSTFINSTASSSLCAMACTCMHCIDWSAISRSWTAPFGLQNVALWVKCTCASLGNFVNSLRFHKHSTLSHCSKTFKKGFPTVLWCSCVIATFNCHCVKQWFVVLAFTAFRNWLTEWIVPYSEHHSKHIGSYLVRLAVLKNIYIHFIFT